MLKSSFLVIYRGIEKLNIFFKKIIILFLVKSHLIFLPIIKKAVNRLFGKKLIIKNKGKNIIKG